MKKYSCLRTCITLMMVYTGFADQANAQWIINEGVTINQSSGYIVCQSGFVNNGGTFLPGTGTVLFTGSSEKIISSTGEVTFYNLEIDPASGMVTISPGTAVTVTAGSFNTGGKLIIESDAVNNSGSLIVNGTPTGNVIYNRKMPADKYRYISLPVSSTSFPAGRFWRWNEEQGCWGEDPSEAETTLSASGIGYTVAATDNTLSFVGTVLKELPGVVATAPFATPYVKDRDNWGGGGWNLLGNPFPSALSGVDADAVTNNDFIHHNLSSFDPNYQAMYIYDGTDYTYIAAGIPGYPGGGTFTGTDLQAGQGFFVLAHHDLVTFDFTSDMRTHNTSTVMTKSASTGDAWPGLQLRGEVRRQ